MLTRMEGKTSRRAFLGLAAAGVAAGVASGAAKLFGRPAASGHPAALTASPRPWKPPVPENSLPGDPHWQLHNLGSEHEIEG